MAAPSIPNLNTLRARGGKGSMRGRGRGAFAAEAVSSPEEEAAVKDRIVQQTDLDASLSRLSAVELGYLHDPFAHLFVSSKPQRRLPIMNRGTYVRTESIDTLLKKFLQNDRPSERKQVISLGAGSDTRYFRLLRNESFLGSGPGVSEIKANLIYHEYDMEYNVAEKKASIAKQPFLLRLLGNPETSGGEDGLDGPNYHLHSLDLRDLDAEEPMPKALCKIDIEVPTMIISECCLIYLKPWQADKAALYFTEHLFPKTTDLGMVLYEQILPNDRFGKVMVSNLAARGIILETLDTYGTFDAQIARMRAYGFDDSACLDMNAMWRRNISAAEKDRISSLEIMDEYEEWEMMAAHYCVMWAWRRGNAPRWAQWRLMKNAISQLKTTCMWEDGSSTMSYEIKIADSPEDYFSGRARA